MFRNTVFASLIALGAATGVAQAADNAPQLVNRNGSLEVVNETAGDNVVGGGYATISGGGNNLVYRAGPTARAEEQGRIGTVVGGGDNTEVVYSVPSLDAGNLARATRLLQSYGG